MYDNVQVQLNQETWLTWHGLDSGVLAHRFLHSKTLLMQSKKGFAHSD